MDNRPPSPNSLSNLLPGSTHDASVITAEAEALAQLFESTAWKLFLEPVIGRRALEEDAAEALTHCTPELLASRAAAWRALSVLRQKLESDLQSRINVLATSPTGLTPILLKYYQKPAEPIKPAYEAPATFDPFASDPPMQ